MKRRPREKEIKIRNEQRKQTDTSNRPAIRHVEFFSRILYRTFERYPIIWWILITSSENRRIYGNLDPNFATTYYDLRINEYNNDIAMGTIWMISINYIVKRT